MPENINHPIQFTLVDIGAGCTLVALFCLVFVVIPVQEAADGDDYRMPMAIGFTLWIGRILKFLRWGWIISRPWEFVVFAVPPFVTILQCALMWKEPSPFLFLVIVGGAMGWGFAMSMMCDVYKKQRAATYLNKRSRCRDPFWAPNER